MGSTKEMFPEWDIWESTRMILCSRNEKTGVVNVGIAFRMKKNAMKGIIAVLYSKDYLR